MKTPGQYSHVAAPLAVAVSLLFAVENLRASGPAGAGNTGGTNGTVSSGGATVSGGSHGTAGTAGSSRGPAATGARPGVSFSNISPRLSAGSLTQGPVNRPGAPAASSQSPRLAPPPGQRNANAWNGTSVSPTGNATVRNPTNPTDRPNGSANGRFAGRTPSPAWYDEHSGANHYNHNGDQRGRSHYPYRYRNYPYAYGPVYAPYIGYYGGISGAYSYDGDIANADVADGYNAGTPTVTPQYGDQGQDAKDEPQNPAPSAVPQNPGAGNAAPSAVPDNGPDSLVEAVQQELIRRGYFGGKVDAMYGPDTKDALRKFQQDHHLADSGLINEATLHALQLD